MVGTVGAPHGVEVPIDTVIFRNVGLRGGVAPARKYIHELLPDVLAGRIRPGRVFDLKPTSTGSPRRTPRWTSARPSSRWYG
jgi:threonine dehydrogenase-like Zn-dependent dehydrogenase